MTNIHKRIAEMTDLAKIYAEDGAFHTAANRLRELADEIDAHITAITTCKPDRPATAGELIAYFTTPPRVAFNKPLKPGKTTVIKHREELIPQTPAPGKVMKAPSGSFVPPLAHLTDEQQHAVRKAERERIEREHLDGIKRVDRAFKNARKP